MNIQQAIAQVVQGKHLSREQMVVTMRQIMTGEASPAQIGGFLVAMSMKGETVAEITAAAEVMRELVTPVVVAAEHLVDTCGTGGDGANLFNVSTACAFVVAACGGKVAKHGNRAASSATGSADVLSCAGVSLDLTPAQVARAITEIGVGFMFAPAHHSAMKHAIGPRKELAVRTLFNMLGPMTNPAGVKRQVIGVYARALCRPMAEVLLTLGSEHVLIVHSADGLDELSLAGPSFVAELKDGRISEYTISPGDLGITKQNLDDLSVTSAEESLALIKAAFAGKADPRAQKAAAMIALNAGAAVYAAGIATTLKEGVQRAEDAIASGLPLAKMDELAAFSACFD